MSNGHLSIEEIEELIQQKGPAENHGHVASCQQCRSLLEDCQAFNAKLAKLVSVRIGAESAMNCPDDRVWFDVAAGTLPEAESLEHVQHAAECGSCGPRLKTALRVFEEEFSPNEETQIRTLLGAREYKKLPERLVSLEEVGLPLQMENDTHRRKGFFSWRVPILAFAAIVVASFLGLQGYRSFEILEARKQVDRNYRKGRPSEYRIAGVPYSSPSIIRGESESSFVEVPDWLNQPVLAAKAAFLSRNWFEAAAALEKARTSGNNSAEVLNDLVVAYALQAETPRDNNLYRKALTLSEDVIQRYPSDPVVYFNRGLIFQQLGGEQPVHREEAIRSFKKFIEMESDPRWKAEAEAKLQLLL